MSRIAVVFCSFFFLIPQGLLATGTLTQIVVTKPAPTQGCPTAPASVASFTTTDTAAYLWFLAAGLTSADQVEADFYVSGQSYVRIHFDAPTSASTCFYVTLPIAGNPPAPTGNWTVYILDNGTQLGTVSFTIGGSSACSYSLSSSSASVAATGGSGSFIVTAGSGCTWTASSDVTWIAPAVSGSTVNYTVTANTGTSSRTGHIAVGGQTFTVTQAGASATCSYALSSNSISVAASGGSGSFTVTAGTGCTWTATTSVSWIATAISGSTVNYTVAANTDTSSRTGTITSAGQVFTVTQAQSVGATSAVYYRFENGTANGAATGSGSIADSMGSQNGTPSGTVTYSSDVPLSTVGGVANTLSANFAATGSVQFPGAFPLNSLTNATLEFYVKPAGTTVSEMDILWTRTDSSADANRFNMGIWTSGSSRTVFLDYRDTSGNLQSIFPGGGPLQIPYAGWSHVAVVKTGNVWTGYINGTQMGQPVTATVSLPANTGWTMNGNLRGSGYAFIGLLDEFRISNSALTPSQFLSPVSGSAGACAYSLSASGAFVAAAQSTGSVTVTVTSGSGCPWTVVNGNSWIAIASATSFTGNGTVNYSVAANTLAARSGTLTIAGQTYTVNQAAGGTPSCSYLLNATIQSQPATASGAGNITGQFTVTTNTNCAWTAVSNNSWITIVAGATGTGNGAVSYRVDPNTLTTSRQGTMTIAGQTVTVTQAAGVACSYSITPTSNPTMQALGGSSSIAVIVTAGSSCSWTASVSSSAFSWLHLGSTTSGTGNGSVDYSADANSSTASRTGTITVAGLTFTVTQPGGASATGPNISGIVDAVNYRAAIAQGSFFAIFGTKLGPATPQPNEVFPIPDNLGGVTVTVTQGSITRKAYLVYVSDAQINAIMPSDAPLGNVQVTVNYNGSTTGTAAVVNIAFAINSTAGGTGPGIINNYNSSTDQPLNTASTPAKAGQVEILVGTGLGPITAPDNQPPPVGVPTTPLQVWVGAQQASVAYSGRAPGIAGQDQINFTVPANAPTGCSVPVQVNAGGTWSNTVGMAISSDGSHCQDAFNPLSGLTSIGGNSGTIGLIRINFSGQLSAGAASANATLDLSFGAFTKTNPGGDLAYSPFANLPAPGTCVSTNKGNFDLGTMMAGGLSGLDPTVAATLDAGAQLTVTGGAGGASATLTQTSPNPYMGLLGGILNISGATVPPPFLDGGPFTITGPGGKDVGPFSTEVALAPAIAWINPPSTIDRASPLSLTWTGGDSTQMVVVIGSSTDQTSKAYGGFTCVAPAGAYSFTVPVNSLAGLISTAAATGSSSPIAMLGLMPLEPGSMQLTPLPKGLDVGVVFDTTMTLQTVQVQ